MSLGAFASGRSVGRSMTRTAASLYALRAQALAPNATPGAATVPAPSTLPSRPSPSRLAGMHPHGDAAPAGQINFAVDAPVANFPFRRAGADQRTGEPPEFEAAGIAPTFFARHAGTVRQRDTIIWIACGENVRQDPQQWFPLVRRQYNKLLQFSPAM